SLRSARWSPPKTITCCWPRRRPRSPRIPSSTRTSPTSPRICNRSPGCRTRSSSWRCPRIWPCNRSPRWSRWRARSRASPSWSGTTGAIDFLVAGFLRNAGLSLSKVPYRNQVEAANDLAAGRIQLNETAYAIVRPQLQAGKVKLLAVTNSVRAPVLPDVPTVTEAGYPDLALDGLVGFFGSPEMPLPLREHIAVDVGEVGADPAIAARLNDTGQLPNFGGPAEFHAAIELQRARVAAAAKELGIVPTE